MKITFDIDRYNELLEMFSNNYKNMQENKKKLKVLSDDNGYRFRTAMTMKYKKILELAKTDFHLFPDAGKPKN